VCVCVCVRARARACVCGFLPHELSNKFIDFHQNLYYMTLEDIRRPILEIPNSVMAAWKTQILRWE